MVAGRDDDPVFGGRHAHRDAEALVILVEELDVVACIGAEPVELAQSVRQCSLAGA